MSGMRGRTLRSLVVVIVSSLAGSGCGFLPGFSLFEEPALYYLTVTDVANQVACELQQFMESEKKKAPTHKPRWVLGEDDVSVKLTLQTDHQGYVNFTGVNAAALGFASLQSFIASSTSGKTSVPSLGAKVTAKRTKAVQINFSVSPKTLVNDIKTTDDAGNEFTLNCQKWNETESPFDRLYLRDWLDNYFETINYSKDAHHAGAGNDLGDGASLTDNILWGLRYTHPPKPVPNQFKIQSVELTTTAFVAADISAGATPKVLGNGNVFIVPVNGISLDYNPDYSHKIDFTLNVCDNSPQTVVDYRSGQPLLKNGKIVVDNDPCHPRNLLLEAEKPSPLLTEQCKAYSVLFPLMAGVKPPHDYETITKAKDGKEIIHQFTCAKSGFYVEKSTVGNLTN